MSALNPAVVEPTLKELSVPGHRGPRLQPLDVPARGAGSLLPGVALRPTPPALPVYWCGVGRAPGHGLGTSTKAGVKGSWKG
jgi:hypothetical protein